MGAQHDLQCRRPSPQSDDCDFVSVVFVLDHGASKALPADSFD